MAWKCPSWKTTCSLFGDHTADKDASMHATATPPRLIQQPDRGHDWFCGFGNRLECARPAGDAEHDALGLGDASKLGDYESIKKRAGSRYAMNFNNGVNFDLGSVLTSDSVTAATLSTLVQAGMLYRKMSASATEKVALESVAVNSDSSNIQFHFKTDDKQFQSLLHSDLFAAVSK